MYAVLEYAVCAVLALAIAACLFCILAAFVLLQEALRRFRFMFKKILIASKPLPLEPRPRLATLNAKWRPETSRALPP